MAEQTSTEEINEYNKINRNYQIIYAVVFKYWVILIIFIISIVLFIFEIQKRIILNYDNSHEAEEQLYLSNFKEKLENIGLKKDLNTNILLKDWFLDISENVLHSYNNLVTFKWLTMPRWTYLWDTDNINNIIKDREYFDNPNYDIEELNWFMTNVVYVDFNNIETRTEKGVASIPLENSSIEETFFISCANNFKALNLICNSYIENFLEKFFLYNIDEDIEGTANIFKILLSKKYHKEKTCNSLINYMEYTNKAPTEFEDIVILCWWEYQNYYYLVRDFAQTNHEIDNRYLKSNVSKSKEVNAYKLLSYQQILYNNIEKNIPPYEWTYKDYTNYIASLLQKENENSIDKFYFDVTFWFNNFYLMPNLNKIKYQSTQTKREEVESILSSLEKINNWSYIDWYKWLREVVTNKEIIKKETQDLWITENVSWSSNDTTSILLKNIKSLNYLKIINDEIDENQIKINGYLSIDTAIDTKSIYFGAILENKNGSLIVKDFSLNDYDDLNETIKVIIAQKNYSLQEIYQFIQENISIYLSENITITPCDLLRDKLNTINVWIYELLICNDERINIIKWWDNDKKILYQIKMDNYEIKTLSISDPEIQEYMDNNFTWTKTNSITISNVVWKIISYVPEKTNTTTQALQWSNATIRALDDLRTSLWVIVSDIAEENGKIAAEFELNNIDFIGIYDPTTKKLWPLFLQKPNDKYGLNFKNFSLYLTPENQNEINRFIIETIQYLKWVDEKLVNIYINE